MIFKNNSFPFYKQFDHSDCGPACVRIIAKYYGKYFTRDEIIQKSGTDRQGTTIRNVIFVAESIGLKTLAVNVNVESLQNEIPLPCIAFWNQKHFIVIYKITKKKVYVSDPAYGLLKYDLDKFLAQWLGEKNEQKGILILFEPLPKFYKNDDGKQLEQKGIKFLLPYFYPYKKIISQLILGLLVVSVVQLIVPFLTQSVVDYGINYQDLNFVYIILVAQLMLFLSRSTAVITRDWLLLHLSSRVNITLISDFLSKLMSLPVYFFDSKDIGDILERIKDHERIKNFLSTQTLDVIFAMLSFLIFGAVLAYFSTTIFILYSLGTVAYIVWVSIYMKKRGELDYLTFDQSSLNHSSLIELIQGMQEIKLNNSENKRRWKWEEIQIKLFRLSIKRLSLVQYQYNGGMVISEFKNIIITFIAAKEVIDGSLTLGTMLSIQYIIGQLNAPIRFFVAFIQNYQDAKISLSRIREIHLNGNESNGQSVMNDVTINNSIKLEDLTFRYGGPASPVVLDGLNIEIPVSKVTAIVGVSGSGKTTLLKLLLKLYNVERNKIRIGDVDLNNIDTYRWRKSCGVVMQDGFIFNDTIASNIAESDFMGIDVEKLKEAAEISNLKEFIDSLPKGYNTKIGNDGVPLSGGQKQRILIARAVYKNAPVLIFDEATSSLDSNNEKVIMENLKTFYKGKTVIVVAHRLSTVKNADQILVLDKGKIIENGDHIELTRKRGAYYTLVKNQLELGN